MFRSSASKEKKRRLRSGFSTGTGMTAAAKAALRYLLSQHDVEVVAVRLPDGCLIPIRIATSYMDGEYSRASLTKDGGDDPDVTHRAEIRVKLRCLSFSAEGSFEFSEHFKGMTKNSLAAICLIGGEGVGVVTKPGLPVDVGEPAVNPVPRQMLCRNIAEELLRMDYRTNVGACDHTNGLSWQPPSGPHVMMPLDGLSKELGQVIIEVEVEVPKGKKLAERTLNPRLGIVGGISILGTTGLVKPFSHEAYEETIQSALSVAASNGCRQVVLSTGGKSERFAQGCLPDQSPEAFIQVADFYAFSLKEAQKMGFAGVVHSVFFGKLVKMALGHPYTHAHKTNLDLDIVGRTARERGYDRLFCRQLETANTARHALEMLLGQRALDVVESLAERALQNSRQITENEMSVRIMLFDYDGSLLVDTR